MAKDLPQISSAGPGGLDAKSDVALEPSLGAIPQVLGYLESRCTRFTLGSDITRAVSSAGTQAFCAACMGAQKGLVKVELSLQQGILSLKVGFMGKGKARPYGLAPALFHILGCRTQLEQMGYHWLWTASWEL